MKCFCFADLGKEKIFQAFFSRPVFSGGWVAGSVGRPPLGGMSRWCVPAALRTAACLPISPLPPQVSQVKAHLQTGDCPGKAPGKATKGGKAKKAPAPAPTPSPTAGHEAKVVQGERVAWRDPKEEEVCGGRVGNTGQYAKHGREKELLYFADC